MVGAVAHPGEVAVAEEGLVVVHGELGQAGDQLLHRHLPQPLTGQQGQDRQIYNAREISSTTHLALQLVRPPPAGAHQARLLQVVRQPRPAVILDVERRQLGVARQPARGRGRGRGAPAIALPL